MFSLCNQFKSIIIHDVGTNEMILKLNKNTKRSSMETLVREESRMSFN